MTAIIATPTLAKMFIQQGQLERAKEIYETLVEHHPDNAEFQQSLLDLQEQLKSITTEQVEEPEEQIQDYQEAFDKGFADNTDQIKLEDALDEFDDKKAETVETIPKEDELLAKSETQKIFEKSANLETVKQDAISDIEESTDKSIDMSDTMTIADTGQDDDLEDLSMTSSSTPRRPVDLSSVIPASLDYSDKELDENEPETIMPDSNLDSGIYRIVDLFKEWIDLLLIQRNILKLQRMGAVA